MDQQVVLDPALVRKYDRPGPRYTSYPTAPNFTAAVGPAAYREALVASNEGDALGGPAADLSLYVHLPFCRHLCSFCGCTMFVRRDPRRGLEYLDRLGGELDAVAPLVNRRRVVRQVHFGGGTPTFLPPEGLDRLARMLEERFTFAPDAELGVEVHPNETRPAHREARAAHGWNRISVGVQDFDAEVQRAIRRVQPLAVTRRVIEDARALGFASVNADLIYGLPHQTVARFTATIDELLALAPDRIACYSFAYLPDRMRHQRLLPQAALPSPEEKLAILAAAIRAFTGAGYVFIGFDHFAKPDDELAVAQRAGTLHRNFQGYTTWKGLDLLAFGVSAISSVGRCYAQNTTAPPAYEEAAGAGELATTGGVLLSDDDLLRRELIMELASQFRVEKAPLEARFGIDFDSTFAEALAELEPMQDDGLVELHSDRLQVTPKGRLLVRNLCMPFDAYLDRRPRLFSRTV